MAQHIMIVEDDQAIAELVDMTLRVSGHETLMLADGLSAYEALLREQPALLILDVMLPRLDGFQLVERLIQEQRPLPPLLFLTARIDVKDRVRGLRLGAEDYMLKPFHPIELQARVDGILRRHSRREEACEALGVRLCVNTRQVFRDGREVELTPQEFALLELLMRHQNMALSREQLLAAAWGYDYAGGTRTVDMHIQRLRKKLQWEHAIRTVFKLGYRLETRP